MDNYWNKQFIFKKILQDFDYWQTWYPKTSKEFVLLIDVEIVAYGAEPRQVMRVIRPKQALAECEELGLIPVFLHGGYWRSQDACDYDFVARSLSLFAKVIYNVEYRLIPKINIQQQVQDVIDALKVVYELEQKPLILFGHSAGAHLLFAACQDDFFNQDNIYQINALSGIFDLEVISYSDLQQELHFSKQEIEQYSPLKWQELKAIKTHLINGKLETSEYIRQSSLLYERMKQLGQNQDQVSLSLLEDHHHMSLVSLLSDQKLLKNVMNL